MSPSPTLFRRRHRVLFGGAVAASLASLFLLNASASALPPPPALPQGVPHPALENWDGPAWQQDWRIPHHPERVAAPVPLPEGAGNSGVRLTLPAGAEATPDGGAEIGTGEPTGKGWYGARMKTADCTGQPDAGVKTGLFTYYKDREDRNNTGIEDNSEIDIEFLCSEPHVIHLTLYTDYQPPSAPGGEKLRKVNRSIDLRTGRIIRSACYKESFEQPQCGRSFDGEHHPSSLPAIEGFDSSQEYWDYAFHWHDTGVNFYLYDKTRDNWLQLWDYRGPQDRVPSLAGTFRHNVWWNEAWKDEQGGGGEQPRIDTEVSVDYSFWPGS
ncbi:glycoside hydrolase family 16 protein [Streptomyces sp. ACA25]|uniref:glycoside hydrolase family 16 protein n=1 Tax=Streptomyces sp. ACA25 TaxID=3022596 RepID=UPI002306FFF5|nr:glycoside hydrolase family 16 protein [Streptomyces sp. ACA25]MDB1086424.1 glycoside hydrolase family 16 protein [Streptomyces sp. ACA25]